MTRFLSSCSVVVLASMTLLAMSAPVASAKGCDTIKLSGKRYVFYKQNIACDTAKRKARRLHRTKREPRRFDCQSGTNFRTGAYCQHERRENKFFGWHPFD